jgi:hypothetical protein
MSLCLEIEVPSTHDSEKRKGQAMVLRKEYLVLLKVINEIEINRSRLCPCVWRLK